MSYRPTRIYSSKGNSRGPSLLKAEIRARQVVILGAIAGNVVAREKVEIRRSGHVVGDLKAGAVAIEEGAYFRGSIDILREEAQEGSRSTPPLSPLETSA